MKQQTDELKSKVSVEKEFEDVKDVKEKLNLKCDLIKDTDFIKNVELKEIKIIKIKNEKLCSTWHFRMQQKLF